MTDNYIRALGRLCMSPERASGYRMKSLASRLTAVWRLDAGQRTYAGASDSVVMALVECTPDVKLPCGPDEALSVAGAILWPRHAKGRMLHKDLLGWAKRMTGRKRYMPADVSSTTIDAAHLAVVLETVPDRGEVRLRPGGMLGRHFLDLCGIGWAARIMGNQGEAKIALDGKLVLAP